MDWTKIKWRTYKGLAGDLQTLLIGTYENVSFSRLFFDTSLFDWSLKRAKRKIISAIKILHTQ